MKKIFINCLLFLISLSAFTDSEIEFTLKSDSIWRGISQNNGDPTVGASIARVFFITASTFGAMSIYGYTTKRDLTNFGSFLFMGLIGIIIASIVNIFMQSPALYFGISILGVLIFVGLTAYDTQKIKNMYMAYDSGEVAAKKAIMGALTLYLDFINLFIMLLRLFGQRR